MTDKPDFVLSDGREVVFDEAVFHARLGAGGQEGGEVEGSGAHIGHAAVGLVVLQVEEWRMMNLVRPGIDK